MDEAAHKEVGKTALGEATHGETGKAMLIKIRVQIGCGPLGGDIIQSGGNFKSYHSGLNF